MNKKMKLKIALIGCIVLAFGIIFTYQVLMQQKTPAEAADSPTVGSSPPDFTLKNLDNVEVTLSELKGTVVFLNFWASWCPPCRSEMPSMENLKGEMEGYEFKIIAVSLDRITTDDVKEFVEDNGYTFEILHDTTFEVSDKYQVMGIPTTFIIDKDGIIVEISVGSENWSTDERIKQLKTLAEN